MCGIVGYIGENDVCSILIEKLKALEYRGYDSAGVAICDKKDMHLIKTAGHVEELEKAVKQTVTTSGTVGIGHTRWATHGFPNRENAHPHTDCNSRIAVVHNGIIENYKEIKEYLEQLNHTFLSTTDTEVIPHLIEEFLKQENDFTSALFKTVKLIKGAYALAIIDKENPDAIYAVRMSSPLVIGIGNKENFLASDATALVGQTKKVIYLRDEEIATITKDNVTITNLQEKEIPQQIALLEWNLEQAQKGNYPHFMLKEIFDGPEVVKSTLRGRVKSKESVIKLGGLEQVANEIKNAKRIIILGCGTSYYAGLVGEYFFEEITNIPTEVHFASEFRYRKEPLEKDTIVIAISQSGETADTLAAIKKAKEHGLLTLGIVNTVGSTIARETDAGVYNHAGPEIGVASTKAFMSQLVVLLLMSIYFCTTEKQAQHHDLLKEIETIPKKMQEVLDKQEEMKVLAEKYMHSHNFLFLGRRYSYPVALEGALKLKEVSYIHAEGYGAGEMKHGPLALISEDFPTIAIAPHNSISEKMSTNLEEIKSRKGHIIAITNKEDKAIASVVNDLFFVPKTIEPLEPLLTVIPLQLFAYYVGTKKGFNVDKPRNLAKSVTVE